MEFKSFRSEHYDDTTISIFVSNGRFFGYALEDVVRAKGIKVAGKTAIPAGRYEVAVTWSNRFKREMPLLKSVENFEGIRIHGLNNHTQTDGCIGVARNHPTSRTIQGSLESEITKMIKDDANKGIKSYITIFDCRG